MCSGCPLSRRTPPGPGPMTPARGDWRRRGQGRGVGGVQMGTRVNTRTGGGGAKNALPSGFS